MVACQLPKLNARVRFPLPAPKSERPGDVLILERPERSGGATRVHPGMFEISSAASGELLQQLWNALYPAFDRLEPGFPQSRGEVLAGSLR